MPPRRAYTLAEAPTNHSLALVTCWPYSARFMVDHQYRAPFGPDGSRAIDAVIARRLLTAALRDGGDYADLFFEYCVSGSYAYDEEKLKSAGRAVTLGLGVRVMSGDATGYAYVEDLSMEAMEAAARTAAQIAKDGSSTEAQAVQVHAAAARLPGRAAFLGRARGGQARHPGARRQGRPRR